MKITKDYIENKTSVVSDALQTFWGKHKVKLLVSGAILGAITAVALVALCWPAAFGAAGLLAALHIGMITLPIAAKITLVAAVGSLTGATLAGALYAHKKPPLTKESPLCYIFSQIKENPDGIEAQMALDFERDLIVVVDGNSFSWPAQQQETAQDITKNLLDYLEIAIPDEDQRYQISRLATQNAKIGALKMETSQENMPQLRSLLSIPESSTILSVASAKDDLNTLEIDTREKTLRGQSQLQVLVQDTQGNIERIPMIQDFTFDISAQRCHSTLKF